MTSYAQTLKMADRFGSKLVGFQNRNVYDKLTDGATVKDNGAVGDGVADDTAAFNLATQATVGFSALLAGMIQTPAGNYRIRSSIYIRKGQTFNGGGALINASDNDTVSRFRLGEGLIAGVATTDAGGDPVAVTNLRSLGGSAANGFFRVAIQGFRVSDVFMSSCGIGFETASGAADGIVSNIQIDQSTLGFVFNGLQNSTFNNINLYSANYGFSFRSGCYDIAITGGVISYSTTIAHEYNNTGTNIKGVVVNGTAFLSNVQASGTFLGYVYVAATNVEAQYVNCSFRNCYQMAVNINSGTGHRLTFADCVWDGNRTNPIYNQSTTAQALNISGGVTGTYIINGGEIRNHPGQPVTIGGTGAVIVYINETVFSGNTGGTADVSITNTNAASRVYILGARSDRTMFANTGSAVVEYVPIKQDTGWTAGTGTPSKAAFATYAGQTQTASYVQATVQALDDATRNASQRLLAVENALRGAGLVN